MEEYFRGLIEKCKYGELSANDILEKVAKTDFPKPASKTIPLKLKKNKESKTATQNKENQEVKKEVQKEVKKEVKENKVSSVTQIKNLRQPPSSLLSVSSKSTEPETIQTSHNTSIEHASKSDLWRTVSTQQAERRISKIAQLNDDFNLQQYIENTLAKLFDRIGPIHDKVQLEDIKRKCRMKWFLRMKKLKEERKVKEEELFQENCSFQPKINQTEARPRYLETQPKVHIQTYNQECTFTPNLNRSYVSSSCRNITGTNESFTKNTYNRKNSNRSATNSANRNNIKTSRKGSISNRMADVEKRHHTTNTLAFEDDLHDLMENFYPLQPCPHELSPKMQLEDLQPEQENRRVEKVLDFNGISNSKTQRLKTEMSKTLRTEDGLTRRCVSPMTWKRAIQTPKEKPLAASEKPQIKVGSKATPRETPKAFSKSSTLRARQGNDKVEEKTKRESSASVARNQAKSMTKQQLEDFFNRNETFSERRMKRLDKVESQLKEKHPFKPQISKNAQQLDKKIHEEKVLNFVKNKEERLTKLREISAAKELEGVTLQPKINTTVPASSKLNINLPTKDYVEKLKEKEEVEKQFMEMVKRRKEALETIECTHRPQINEVPCFLKKDQTSLTSPKLNISAAQPTNYKGLHQKKKQTPTSSSKPLFWGYQQKENINMPSLFDGMIETEYIGDE